MVAPSQINKPNLLYETVQLFPEQRPVMSTTIAEMALSAPYREAQRAFAAWLDRDTTTARRQKAFSARTAMTRLNSVERHALARWLAWLCLAANARGESLLARIQRLDPALAIATENSLLRLPHYIGRKLHKATRKMA